MVCALWCVEFSRFGESTIYKLQSVASRPYSRPYSLDWNLISITGREEKVSKCSKSLFTILWFEVFNAPLRKPEYYTLETLNPLQIFFPYPIQMRWIEKEMNCPSRRIIICGHEILP